MHLLHIKAIGMQNIFMDFLGKLQYTVCPQKQNTQYTKLSYCACEKYKS